MSKSEKQYEDILWCPSHDAIGTQCCGGKKEKIGQIEYWKGGTDDVQQEEL